MIYMTTTILESRQKTTSKREVTMESNRCKRKEIDVKLKGEGNTTNENNEDVIEIDYPFLFQIVLDLKKKMFFIMIFQKLVSK